MNSMTGFGRAQKTSPIATVEAQLCAYNKRGLEVSVQLPREVEYMESQFTELPRKNRIAMLKAATVGGWDSGINDSDLAILFDLA